MSVGAFPVVIFHDVATENEIEYMQNQVRKQVCKNLIDNRGTAQCSILLRNVQKVALVGSFDFSSS